MRSFVRLANNGGVMFTGSSGRRARNPNAARSSGS